MVQLLENMSQSSSKITLLWTIVALRGWILASESQQPLNTLKANHDVMNCGPELMLIFTHSSCDSNRYDWVRRMWKQS